MRGAALTPRPPLPMLGEGGVVWLDGGCGAYCSLSTFGVSLSTFCSPAWDHCLCALENLGRMSRDCQSVYCVPRVDYSRHVLLLGCGPYSYDDGVIVCISPVVHGDKGGWQCENHCATCIHRNSPGLRYRLTR